MEQKTYELSELMKNPDNGFVINGIKMNKYEPLSSATVDHWKSTLVSSAGDFNGDGKEDLLLGSPAEDPSGKHNAGSAYVVFGKSNYNKTLDLMSSGRGASLQISGINSSDWAGFSVSSAGDFNGDGFSDVIIGAPNADPSGQPNAGSAYVVFGESVSTGSINLGSLDGNNGFILSDVKDGDATGDSAGFSVSYAGDVNNDGFDDVIIGSPSSDPNGSHNAGRAYVVFGKKNLTKHLDLGTLDGTNGFILNGVNLVVDSVSSAGFSVYGAGDLNGDKFDDILVGLPFSSPDLRYNSGEVYIIYGKSAFPEALNLEDIDQSTGVVIKGVDNKDLAGFSMSSAGDINNDGMYDILIGAPFSDPHGREKSGQSYLVFGNSNLPAVIDLRTLDGTNGFYINGANDQDLSGFSLSSVGDINKDGFGDIIIGAPFAESGNKENSGKCYILFGNNTFEKEVNLRSFNESTGITINGINSGDLSSFSLSSVKDMNGDGMDEIVTLSSRPDSEGQAYVIYSSALFPTTTTTSSSSSLTTGTTITDTSFTSTISSTTSATSTTSVTGTSATGTITSSSVSSSVTGTSVTPTLTSYTSSTSTESEDLSKVVGIINSTSTITSSTTTGSSNEFGKPTIEPPSDDNNEASTTTISLILLGVAAVFLGGFVYWRYSNNKDKFKVGGEVVLNGQTQEAEYAEVGEEAVVGQAKVFYEQPVSLGKQQISLGKQPHYYEEATATDTYETPTLVGHYEYEGFAGLLPKDPQNPSSATYDLATNERHPTEGVLYEQALYTDTTGGNTAESMEI